MPAVIPRADFPDPLLEQRGARRMAAFKKYVASPWALAGVVASFALALIHPYVVPAGWLVVVVGAFALADRRARAQWWVSLLEHLGLQSVPGNAAPPLSPLLRSGDEREILRAGGDAERTLMIFRSTDVSRDSKGRRTTSHHDYTVVVLRRPTPAIRFLSAHEHRFSALKFLGDDLRGRTMRDVEEFKVESVALAERFTLRCSTEDATRARQLFKPSFIVWFTHSGVPFEYEVGHLVVFVDRVLEHAEEFKVLLSRAAAIDAALHGEEPATG